MSARARVEPCAYSDKNQMRAQRWVGLGSRVGATENGWDFVESAMLAGSSLEF